MDASALEAKTEAERIEEFAGKVTADIGGALAALLAYIGDRNGVYRALRDRGPADTATLAAAAGVDERYLREWLSAQAAAGYVTYDPAGELFSLTPEQAVVLAEDGHPACLQGFVELLVAQFAGYEKAAAVFRSGEGRPWSDHPACCFCGVDRFFRPGYAAELVEAWIPALEGLEAKLQAGAKVADVGCGFGSSTILMAQAFPRSVFYGFDFHGPSVETARQRAAEAGVAINARFEVAPAKDLPEGGFDLICLFDALHDMGDPVGAARHLRERLAPDGTVMLVEPLAGDSLSENLHLLGQLFYSGSTLICTPASRAQEVGLALGAQAGQKRLTEVLNQAGFTQVRRAAESHTNMILEARP